MKRHWMRLSILLIGVACGCSGSKPEAAVAQKGAGEKAVAPKGPPAIPPKEVVGTKETKPAESKVEKSESSGDKDSESETAKSEESGESNQFVVPYDKKRDIFKPPPAPPPPPPPSKKEPDIAVAKPVNNQPAPVPVPVEEDLPPPPVRLVGFSDFDGLKAILSVDGKPCLAEEGDVVLKVAVVSIHPPSIDLKFDEHEWSINLLEQPIKNAPTNTGPLYRSNGGSSGSSRSTSSRSSPSSAPVGPASPKSLPGQSGIAGNSKGSHSSNTSSSTHGANRATRGGPPSSPTSNTGLPSIGPALPGTSGPNMSPGSAGGIPNLSIPSMGGPSAGGVPGLGAPSGAAVPGGSGIPGGSPVGPGAPGLIGGS